MCWSEGRREFTIGARRRVRPQCSMPGWRRLRTEENNNEMVASARRVCGIALRLLCAGAGNNPEGAPSAAAVLYGARESPGTLVRETHRRIEGPHQVPDLSVDATRRLGAAVVRPGQGWRGGRDLDG